MAGPGGIEPPPQVLETYVLPLYDGPMCRNSNIFIMLCQEVSPGTRTGMLRFC